MKQLLIEVSFTLRGEKSSNRVLIYPAVGKYDFSRFGEVFDMFSFFIVKSIQNKEVTIVFDGVTRIVSTDNKATFSLMTTNTNGPDQITYGVKTVSFMLL